MGRERELPPPLEMMCLNALWEIQEGNVEDVRKFVSQNRTLAYTTVLTLLDRLARRGAVSRRKEGRGFRYQPTVARDKLRRLALRNFLEYHFDGSEAKLKIFLEQPVEEPAPAPTLIEETEGPELQSKAAAASFWFHGCGAYPEAARVTTRFEDPDSRDELAWRRRDVASGRARDFAGGFPDARDHRFWRSPSRLPPLRRRSVDRPGGLRSKARRVHATGQRNGGWRAGSAASISTLRCCFPIRLRVRRWCGWRERDGSSAMRATAAVRF